MSANPSFRSELLHAGGAAIGTSGAAIAAVVGACCWGPTLGPLAISLLGVGPIVALAGLRSYVVPILVASGIVIGISFWLGRRSKSWSRSLTWISGFVWIAAVIAVVWARLAVGLGK